MADKTSPLRVLRGWRRYVKVVTEAVKAAIPGTEVYVVGGAAEGRLTVESDIDILVVLPHKPSFAECVELRARILEEAEKLGLPPYAPIELHMIGKEELEEYVKRGEAIPVGEARNAAVGV